jgi:hypothetical protein
LLLLQCSPQFEEMERFGEMVIQPGKPGRGLAESSYPAGVKSTV